jgi:hypothetical protein
MINIFVISIPKALTPAAISAVAYGRPYSVCTETALNLYRLAAGEGDIN